MATKKTRTGSEKKLVKDDVQRVGDKIVITKVWEAPAKISFDVLLDACVIESDDGYGRPWEEDTGYDHDFIQRGRYEDVVYRAGDDIKQATGHVCRSQRDGGSGLLVLTETCQEEYDYYHAKGYSKQQAREKQAAILKARLEQLVKWYEDGWWVFFVGCCFRGYSASTGGILCDDECDDSLDDVKEEMAREVMGEMEDDGYEFVDVPPTERPFNEWYSKVNGYRVTQGLITRERLRQYWEEHVSGKAHVLHELLHE